MNPDSNRLEPLSVSPEIQKQLEKLQSDFEKHQRLTGFESEFKQPLTPESPQLFRPNGKPVPSHWPIFFMGEELVVKNYLFKIAYIGETSILLEPVGPVIIGEDK